MKVHKLSEFTKGWFIGDFDPSLLKTSDFEIAMKRYSEGDYEKSHAHKIATEYTLIVKGTVKMNEEFYTAGDIVEIHPGEFTDFKAITNTITVVVKVPCTKNDKFEK